MNPTAMEACRPKGPAPLAPGGPEVLTSEFYDRIVNIAGIGAGDTVAYAGAENAFFEALLFSKGGRIQMVPTSPGKDRLRKAPRNPSARADAVLWDADGPSWTNPSRTLASLRSHLRPGGRLVLWRSPCDRRDRRVCPEAMERLLASAGFVSVIVGRLTGLTQDAVVATGVLNKQHTVEINRR